MACTVTSTDAAHGYRLITTYVTDPARDTVLMNTRLQALPGSGANLARLHLYARLDAHVTDQARNFTATPGGFTFGVCAPGGTAPVCSANPDTVPKAVDVITPAGVTQATELDPTLGPVVIQPVPVP